MGCGFKPLNQQTNLIISQLNLKGNQKINYHLKNKVYKISNTEKGKKININIETNTKKTIKEKNISNEITKYEIYMTAKVTFILIETKQEQAFSVNTRGDFNVSKQYSATLNNEKILNNSLINDLANKIIKNLISKVNDF
jgi:hypothetical protein